MSTRIGRIAGATGALVATGALAAVVFNAVAGAGSAEPTSAPAAVVETVDYSGLPSSYGIAAEQETDAAAAVAAEQERIATEAAAAEAARVAAEQAAAAEAERVASAAEQVVTEQAVTDQAAEESPAPPVKCPAGSTANSGDGGNDTSCFPDICFHITLPDPNHPECVTAFKP